MKASEIRFAQLQRFLAQIGFFAVRDQEGWRFEHPSSNTVFLFRAYRPADRVYEHDLFLVRAQLDGRGLISEEEFSESLTKTSA